MDPDWARTTTNWPSPNFHQIHLGEVNKIRQEVCYMSQYPPAFRYTSSRGRTTSVSAVIECRQRTADSLACLSLNGEIFSPQVEAPIWGGAMAHPF